METKIRKIRYVYPLLFLLIVTTIYVWMLFTGGVCMQIAKSFAKKGDFSTATLWAERAGKLDMFNANYHIAVAVYLDKTKNDFSVVKSSKVKTSLENALKICSILPDANYEMSRFCQRQGDVVNARYFSDEIRRLDPLGKRAIYFEKK